MVTLAALLLASVLASLFGSYRAWPVGRGASSTLTRTTSDPRPSWPGLSRKPINFGFLDHLRRAATRVML
jgi:hypothetical protein